MPVPQTVSIFLNNALKPTPVPAELDGDAPLPEVIRDMPDQIGGRFVGLEAAAAHDIESAVKRVMTLNALPVLYTFTFDSRECRFSARKR